MDLWQFCCYIDGFDARCRQVELDYFKLAARFASLNNATRKASLDAKIEAKEIKDDIYRLLSGEEKEIKTAEDEIDSLKKNLKYFE